MTLSFFGVSSQFSLFIPYHSILRLSSKAPPLEKLFGNFENEQLSKSVFNGNETNKMCVGLRWCDSVSIQSPRRGIIIICRLLGKLFFGTLNQGSTGESSFRYFRRWCHSSTFIYMYIYYVPMRKRFNPPLIIPWVFFLIIISICWFLFCFTSSIC